MCTNAFKCVFLIFVFLSPVAVAAAECIQPVVVNPNSLIASTTFVGIRDQVMDPSAGRIAMQAASILNKRETDATIDQQIEYIRCVASIGKNERIIASISESGAIVLQHGILTGSEKDVTASNLL